MNLFYKICVKFFQVKLLFVVSIFVNAAQASSFLDFPAEKNNIQVLPQKFEYSLRDATKLLLGNRIIDTSQFGFRISPSTSSVQIEMRWPSNLFEKSRLRILNPSGVAVWSEHATSTQDHLILPNASMLLQKLMGLSFFRFCVGYHEINTGMEICSPESVVKGIGSNIHVENRNIVRKSSITINGRSVTPHGIVFLNDLKESLSFRAFTTSGAEFRMDTRRIQLEFPDVLDADEKHFIITVVGPTPLPPAQYKKISENRWSIALKKDRPLFYVAGEGKVPLRQEFIVQGALPTKKHRLVINKDSAKLTYASSVEISGSIAELGTPQSGDGSEVYVAGKSFSWFLKNIPSGQEKTVYMQNRDGDQIFTAAHTVSRYDSSRLEFLLGANSDDFHFYFGGEAQTWLESLPYIESWTTQKLGVGIIYNQDLTGDSKVILSELDFYYRLQEGLQLLEPTWLAGLAIQNWSFDSQTLQTFSPIIGWQGPSPSWAKTFDWQEMDLKYSVPKSSSNVKLNQRIQGRWKIYQKLKSEDRLRYSLGFYMQEVDSEKKKQTTGLLAEAAWVLTF